MALNDPQRIISSVSMSPNSSAGNLAALTDNLGRVLILDVDEGVIIRIIKGVRDAQVGWILTTLPEDPVFPSMPRKALLLAVYSSRGALEVFAMRSGHKVIAIQVERGLKLLQVAHGMLGGAYWRMNTKQEYEYSCFLISSSGEMMRILVPPISLLG
jgi:hypothetical protein